MFKRFQDILDMVAVGAIMMLAAAANSPYAEHLAAVWDPYWPPPR
jgi:hypothetical protein